MSDTVISEALAVESVGKTAEWRDLGLRCYGRSVGICPVGESEDRSGPHLRDTMVLEFGYGVIPEIRIGSRLGVGDEGYSLLDIVETGTPAHPIDPVNSSVLVFKAGGTTVFAAHVNHPGTKANKFIERAMLQIVHAA